MVGACPGVSRRGIVNFYSGKTAFLKLSEVSVRSLLHFSKQSRQLCIIILTEQFLLGGYKQAMAFFFPVLEGAT